MAPKNVLVLYYSGNGNTQRMAKAIAEGLSSSAVSAKVENVEKFDTKHLPDYDALVVGSPTYFSNMAWQMKKMIDESIVHYRRGNLKGKVAGIFTSAGTRQNGKECLATLEVALGHHHEMRVIEGVLRVDGEGAEEVEKRCKEYGKRLGKEIGE